jgi:DNA-binding NarL/FixJ family response regulator
VTPWRVLIADERLPLRARLRKVLQADPGFTVAGEVDDAAAAVGAAMRELPDLIVLAAGMRGAAAATWEITSRRPDVRVVLMATSDDNEAELFEALRAGASGYLVDETAPKQLVAELRTVMGGDVVIPRGLVTRLVEEFRDHSARRRMLIRSPDAPPLTSREWEVLELLRQGATTAEIARRLSLSPATVRSHIAAVVRKLDVPDRESAVRALGRRSGEERPDVEAQRMIGYVAVRTARLS